MTTDRPEASTSPPTGSTRDALMEATLGHLSSRGVLAGLNLREIADAVGVTPANIYHYFGSRRGLLRAAINHRIAQLTEPIDVAVHSSFVEWRLAIFDLVQALPEMRLTALLALDDDPNYEPIPLWDVAQEHYARLRAEGEIPAELDVVAVHVLTLGAAMAVGIYGDGASAQLGIERAELNERVRTMMATLLQPLVEGR